MSTTISSLTGGQFLSRIVRIWKARSLTQWRKGKTPMKIACFPGDDIGDNIIAHGFYEDLLLEGLFGDFLAENAGGFKAGVVLDVGANIGNHSLFFSERFAEVFSFEPNPICTRLLEANLLMNSVENVRIFELGLSDAETESIFHLNREGNIGRSGVGDSLAASAGKHFRVRLVPGDDVMAGQELHGRRVELIKLDVEGHEMPALLGLRGLIAEHQPLVLFESHGAKGASGSDAIVDFLESLGYFNFYVVERVRSPFRARIARALYRMARGQVLDVKKVGRPGDRSYSLIVASCSALSGRSEMEP